MRKSREQCPWFHWGQCLSPINWRTGDHNLSGKCGILLKVCTPCRASNFQTKNWKFSGTERRILPLICDRPGESMQSPQQGFRITSKRPCIGLRPQSAQYVDILRPRCKRTYTKSRSYVHFRLFSYVRPIFILPTYSNREGGGEAME